MESRSGGGLVFEVVKQPPASLVAQLKRAIKEQAGFTWPVELRVKADAEDEPAAEEPTAEDRTAAPPGKVEPPLAPPPQSGPLKGAVVRRLNGLAGALKVALAGPNAARVQALSVAVNGLIRSADFEQASKVLDELEPLVAGGWQARVKAVTERVKAAVAAGTAGGAT